MTKNTLTPSRNIYFLVIAVALSAISIVISLLCLQKLEGRVDTLTISNTTLLHSLNYRHEKLQFCYINDIEPCDDENIESWSSQNTANPFTLKSETELGKEIRF